MTLVKKAVLNPQEIIDYLRNHPDFFVEHPEILSSLNIPHVTHGNISSLIEYQVTKLREQISDLQKNRGVLEQHSDSNIKFAGNINNLTLQLLSSENLNALYMKLSEGVKNLYSANRVLLLIFNNSTLNSKYPDMRFLASSSNLNFMFTELFHRNKPLCDSLQEEYLQLLFPEEYETIKSTVIVPIVNENWQGLLILASHEINRYQQGTGLNMLVYIKDIVQQMLQRFID